VGKRFRDLGAVECGRDSWRGCHHRYVLFVSISKWSTIIHYFKQKMAIHPSVHPSRSFWQQLSLFLLISFLFACVSNCCCCGAMLGLFALFALSIVTAVQHLILSFWQLSRWKSMLPTEILMLCFQIHLRKVVVGWVGHSLNLFRDYSISILWSIHRNSSIWGTV